MLPKIRMFLWLCSHNSISVKVYLEKRGVVQDEVALFVAMVLGVVQDEVALFVAMVLKLSCMP